MVDLNLKKMTASDFTSKVLHLTLQCW